MKSQFRFLVLGILATPPIRAAELPCSGTASGAGCFDAVPAIGPAEPSPFRWFGRGQVVRLGEAAGTAVVRYASAPAELVAPGPDPKGRLVPIVQRSTRLELRLATGLGRNIDLSLAQAVAVSQIGSGPDALLSQSPRSLASAGISDPRLSLRTRLPENSQHFDWTLRVELTLPLGDERAYLGERDASEAVAVNAYWSLLGVSMVADAGLRVARPTRFGDAILGTSAFCGFGVDYAPLRDDLLHIGLETLLRPMLVPSPDLGTSPNPPGTAKVSRYHVDWVMPAEWLASITSRPSTADLWFSVGFGTALPLSHRTPCAVNATNTSCSPNGSTNDEWFVAPTSPRYQLLGSIAVRR